MKPLDVAFLIVLGVILAGGLVWALRALGRPRRRPPSAIDGAVGDGGVHHAGGGRDSRDHDDFGDSGDSGDGGGNGGGNGGD